MTSQHEYATEMPEIWKYLYEVRKYSRLSCLVTCRLISRALDKGCTYKQIVDTETDALLKLISDGTKEKTYRKYRIYVNRMKGAIEYAGMCKNKQ